MLANDISWVRTPPRHSGAGTTTQMLCYSTVDFSKKKQLNNNRTSSYLDLSTPNPVPNATPKPVPTNAKPEGGWEW